MKLYTEKDMLKAFMAGNSFLNNDSLDSRGAFYELLQSLTPIELPTDELIILNRWDSFKDVQGLEYDETSYVDGFSKGAKWMRDKIKGGQGE